MKSNSFPFISAQILFFVSGTLNAQSQDSTLSLSSSNYIQNLFHVISLQTGINDNIETFIVTAADYEADLRPNTILTNSYKFNYEFIIFSFSYNPGFINRNVDEDERGKTKIIACAYTYVLDRKVSGSRR